MIVPLEQLLNAGSFQFGLMVEHLFRVGIFPLGTGVFGVKIIFVLRRHKGWLHALFLECFPVKSGEPGVFLDHVGSFPAKTTRRLPLNKLVNEIGGLDAPASRNFVLPNHNLPRQNVVSDFFAVPPLVRSASVATLVRDYSHSKIIDCNAVILPAHNFGSHIARRARGVLRIFRIPKTGDAEISHSQVALVVKNKVFGLDISMKNYIFV